MTGVIAAPIAATVDIAPELRGARLGRSRRREQQSAEDQHRDRHDLQHHEATLHVASGPDAHAIDQCQKGKDRDCDDAIRKRNLHKVREIACEGDRDSGHPARLDNEQKGPAVEERRHRTKSIANVGVLAADLRPTRCELGVNERRGERDNSAQDPDADDQ